ncbi:Golgi to ER traffic- protein [Puccinia graminis f. sp. tritici]|uniref:Golgi to ER traffic-protein n=1 Tax=Puccinia graminis f. sp. tritici TaxID=56615 RepID=A0A5B0RBA0_PUCGR|nr:Golgi to ER traffic- protein [Puccinia graminis f. sp. tritici]KAA1122632.1 Golgi to ER traffic- protein [Puccinia graminis f. sp. tritici]
MPQNPNRQVQESSKEKTSMPLSSLQNVTSPATTPPMKVNIPGVGVFIETKKNKGTNQPTKQTTDQQKNGPQIRKNPGNQSDKWKSVPKRKSAKASEVRPPDKPQQPRPTTKKKQPTADDFRKTGRLGITVDPRLSDDSANEDEESKDNDDHVSKVLTQKSTPGRRRHCHSRIESSGDEEPHEGGAPVPANIDKPAQNNPKPKQRTGPGQHQHPPIKPSHSKNEPGGPLLANVIDKDKSAPKETKGDQETDEPSSNDDEPLHTSDLDYPANRDNEESVPSKPKLVRTPANNMIEVANGEWMTIQELRLVWNDYPDIMTNKNVPIQFGRRSADELAQAHTPTLKSPTNPKVSKAVFSGVSVPKLHGVSVPKNAPRQPSTSSAAPDKSINDLRSNPPTSRPSTSSAIQDIMKKYPKDLGSHITPLPKRQISRMPSTTTTIGGALGIPSLAKATLEEMKRMLAIWSRTRDDLSASMQDLRTGGFSSKTPSAYDTLASSHNLIATFCSRLAVRIRVAEESGDSNEIEVLDMVDLTHQDTDPNNGATESIGLKRRGALSDIEDEEDSPINSKRARTSEHQAMETDFLPNDKPPKIINPKNAAKSSLDPSSNKEGIEFTVLYQNPNADPDETVSLRDREREDSLEEGEREDDPPPKSKPSSNPKGKRKSKEKPKITEEEKARRKEEAKRKREEKKNSPYKDPPNPGSKYSVSRWFKTHLDEKLIREYVNLALLPNVWKSSQCQKMFRQYTTMLEMSKNPQWDYGPELMELVADMVTWGSGDTRPDAFYEKPELFTPCSEEIEAFSLVGEPEFRHCLTSTANDPFFNAQVFNLELIQRARNSEADAKCASWKALYSTMIRTDAKDNYTEDNHTQPFIAAGFRKLHTLSHSCVDNLHLYLNPNQVSKTDLVHYKQKTLFEAGKFIIGKIQVLNALPAAKSNINGNGRTPNGLVVLQKRIWETLLCCLMMQNSFFIDYLENCIKDNEFPDKAMHAASKMSRYNRERSLFKEGDVKDINSSTEMKEWGKTRLSAFGSMAVFFLFGAAGWWHCLPDSHNFNQRDVWTLVHLGHARHEWLYGKERLKDRRRDDTPWYEIDSFVRWLLRKANMHCLIPSEVDWESAPRFWAQHVNEKNLSRLAFQDIMVEVCKVKPMKSLNFKGNEAPDVKIRRPSKEIADNIKNTMKSYWTPMIDAYHQRVEDEPVEEEGDQGAQKPSGLPDGVPLFREPSPPFPSSGHSAHSLLKYGKIRTPRSRTESDDEEEEEDSQSSLESSLGNLRGEKREATLSPSPSDKDKDQDSSGTDPSRDSSEDIEDNRGRRHR